MSDGNKLTVVEVPSPAEFDAKLAEYKGKTPNLFVLLTGAPDPATGESWCPDCSAADPVIERVLGGMEGVLLRCPVLRSEYKGNPDYAYRTHKKVKLQAVPTLMKWGRSSAVATLVEGECADEGKVRDMTA